MKTNEQHHKEIVKAMYRIKTPNIKPRTKELLHSFTGKDMLIDVNGKIKKTISM